MLKVSIVELEAPRNIIIIPSLSFMYSIQSPFVDGVFSLLVMFSFTLSNNQIIANKNVQTVPRRFLTIIPMSWKEA